jgi:serine/threonine protein kinase
MILFPSWYSSPHYCHQRREIRIWSGLAHHNITPLLGISYDFGRPGLVLPYYPNGDIITFTRQNPNVHKPTLVGYIMYDHLNLWDLLLFFFLLLLLQIINITSALSYLHGMSVVHGNVKGVSVSIESLVVVSSPLYSE